MHACAFVGVVVGARDVWRLCVFLSAQAREHDGTVGQRVIYMVTQRATVVGTLFGRNLFELSLGLLLVLAVVVCFC